MKRRAAVLAVLLVCAFVVSGCHRMTYRRHVEALRKHKLITQESDSFYLIVADRKGHVVLPHTKVTIASKAFPLELVSDEFGLIDVPLREDLLRENPRFIIDFEGRAGFGYLPTYGMLFFRANKHKGNDSNPPPESSFVQILVTEDVMPAPDVEFEILSRSGPLVIQADQNGIVEVPYDPALISENPPFRVKTCGPYGMKTRETYLQFIAPLSRNGLIPDDAEHVYLGLSHAGTHEPAGNVAISILAGSGTIEIVSDKSGILKIPITQSLKDEDPPVVIHSWSVLSAMSCLGGAGSFGAITWRSYSKANLVTLYPQDKEAIVTPDFTVWYERDCRQEAEDVVSLLERQREVIRNMTGREPVEWCVVIFRELTPNATYITRRAKSRPYVWCYSVDEVSNGIFAEINTHEWAEHTLTQGLAIYDHDRKNRFIGDGLAEYAAYLAMGRYRGELPQHDIPEDDRYVDLLKEFPARRFFPVLDVRVVIYSGRENEGDHYALSFAFWKALCDEFGDDLPKRFLERFAESQKRDSQSAIAILENLTGAGDIRERLTHADVAAAAKLIEGLAFHDDVHDEALPGAGASR